MKLSYWYAECLIDDNCCSIREQTEKAAQKRKDDSDAECLGALEWNDKTDSYDTASLFGPVHAVEVNYISAFDLLKQITVEGGLHEEAL